MVTFCEYRKEKIILVYAVCGNNGNDYICQIYDLVSRGIKYLGENKPDTMYFL